MLQRRIVELVNGGQEAEVDRMRRLAEVEVIYGQMGYIQEQFRELNKAALVRLRAHKDP
jgi:hypothetical protein